MDEKKAVGVYSGDSEMNAKNNGEGEGGGWGLALLLVFFFDEETHNDEDPKYIDKKRRHSSSSSPFKSTVNKILLVSRAQSIISMCALIFFSTLLIFTLCTFEPTSSISPSHTSHFKFKQLGFSCRWLFEKTPLKIYHIKSSAGGGSNSVALQGMGSLFRRGTKTMNDLLVAHLTEDVTDDDLRLFLRTLNISQLMLKFDVVFIFHSSISANFSTASRQENESFMKLVHHYRNKLVNGGFDFTQFVKFEKKLRWTKKKMVRFDLDYSAHLCYVHLVRWMRGSHRCHVIGCCRVYLRNCVDYEDFLTNRIADPQ